jgi:hypothetical protein
MIGRLTRKASMGEPPLQTQGGHGCGLGQGAPIGNTRSCVRAPKRHSGADRHTHCRSSATKNWQSGNERTRSEDSNRAMVSLADVTDSTDVWAMASSRVLTSSAAPSTTSFACNSR